MAALGTPWQYTLVFVPCSQGAHQEHKGLGGLGQHGRVGGLQRALERRAVHRAPVDEQHQHRALAAVVRAGHVALRNSRR